MSSLGVPAPWWEKPRAERLPAAIAVTASEFVGNRLGHPSVRVAPVDASDLSRRNLLVIDRCIRALDAQSGQPVPDAGFGGTVAMRLLCQEAEGGHEVDPSTMSIDAMRWGRRLAARNVRAFPLGVRLRDPAGVPFPRPQGQRELAVTVVCLCGDMATGVAELHSALHPGGTVAMALTPPSLQERVPAWARPGPSVSHEDLTVLLERTGFAHVGRWPDHAPGGIVVGQKL